MNFLQPLGLSSHSISVSFTVAALRNPGYSTPFVVSCRWICKQCNNGGALCRPSTEQLTCFGAMQLPGCCSHCGGCDLVTERFSELWSMRYHVVIQVHEEGGEGQSSFFDERLCEDEGGYWMHKEQQCSTNPTGPRPAVAFGAVGSMLLLGNVYTGMIVDPPLSLASVIQSAHHRANPCTLQHHIPKNISFGALVSSFGGHLVGMEGPRALLLLHSIHLAGADSSAKLHIEFVGQTKSGKSSCMKLSNLLLGALGVKSSACRSDSTASVKGSRLTPLITELFPTKGRSGKCLVAGCLPTCTDEHGDYDYNGGDAPASCSVVVMQFDGLDKTLSHFVPVVEAILSPFPIAQIPRSGTMNGGAQQFASLSRVTVVAARQCTTTAVAGAEDLPFDMRLYLHRALSCESNARISQSVLRSSSASRCPSHRGTSVASSQGDAGFQSSEFWFPSDTSSWGLSPTGNCSTTFVSAGFRSPERNIVSDLGVEQPPHSWEQLAQYCKAAAGLPPPRFEPTDEPTGLLLSCLASLAVKDATELIKFVDPWLPSLSPKHQLLVLRSLVVARARLDLSPVVTLSHVHDVLELCSAQAAARCLVLDLNVPAAFGSFQLGGAEGLVRAPRDAKKKGSSQKDLCRTFLARLASAQHASSLPTSLTDCKILYASICAFSPSAYNFEEMLQKLSHDGLVLRSTSGSIKVL